MKTRFYEDIDGSESDRERIYRVRRARWGGRGISACIYTYIYVHIRRICTGFKAATSQTVCWTQPHRVTDFSRPQRGGSRVYVRCISSAIYRRRKIAAQGQIRLLRDSVARSVTQGSNLQHTVAHLQRLTLPL